MDPVLIIGGGTLALLALSGRASAAPGGIPLGEIPATTATGAPAPPIVPGNYADSRVLEAEWNARGYYIGSNLPAEVLNASVNFYCWAQVYMPLYSAAVGTNIRFNPDTIPGQIDAMASLEGLVPTSEPRAPASIPTPPPGRPPRGFGDGSPLTPRIGIDPVTITAVIAVGIKVVDAVIGIFKGSGDGAATLINSNITAINAFYNSLGVSQATKDNATSLLIAMRFDLAALEIVGALQRGEGSNPNYAPIYHPGAPRFKAFTPFSVLGVANPDGTVQAGGSPGFFEVAETALDLGVAAVDAYQSFDQALANETAG